MKKMQLLVRVEGASAEEVHKGGLAAMAIFEQAGVTPLQAAEASFARNGWDLSGFDDEYEGYTTEDSEIAHLWHEAAVKAAEVACATWPADRKRPESAVLEIVH
jgi:hypothetical protein